jgi:hypothetical protein
VIPLYADEDSMGVAVIRGLAARGVQILTTTQAGMRHRSDLDQLEFAKAVGRVIFTHNAGDFLRLHARYMRGGQHHAGIIVAYQGQFGIGESIRRLTRLATTLSAADMVDRVVFLSDW